MAPRWVWDAPWPDLAACLRRGPDPGERHRSLGTWNVLNLIDRARARGLSHLYLGYYVAGCPSMAYKTRFAPNQVLGEDGHWHDFQG